MSTSDSTTLIFKTISGVDDLLLQVRELAVYVRRQDLSQEEEVIRDQIMRRMQDVMPLINSFLVPLPTTQSDTTDKEE